MVAVSVSRRTLRPAPADASSPSARSAKSSGIAHPFRQVLTKKASLQWWQPGRGIPLFVEAGFCPVLGLGFAIACQPYRAPGKPFAQRSDWQRKIVVVVIRQQYNAQASHAHWPDDLQPPDQDARTALAFVIGTTRQLGYASAAAEPG